MKIKKITNKTRCFIIALGFLFFPFLGANAETIQGKLHIQRVDYDEGHAETIYLLETDDDVLQLIFQGGDLPTGFRFGDQTEVTGSRSGSTFLLMNVADMKLVVNPKKMMALDSPVGAPIGSIKLLAMLVNFQNDARQPETVAVSSSILFNHVNKYYREVSYGQTSLTGDVTGYYTLPMDASCGLDDILSIQTKANLIATNRGYDLSQYTGTMYIFPRQNCNWSGRGNKGSFVSWFNGGLGQAITAHELGHNFGVFHAKTIDCGHQPYRLNKTSCSENEYGDAWDIMGRGDMTHMNASFKEQINWTSILPVTVSGVYEINPIELSSSPVKGVKIVSPDSSDPRTYFIEYRQKMGSDAVINNSNVLSGAMIHIGGESTLLLDMNPQKESPFSAPALEVGKTFRDPGSTLALTVVSTAVTGLKLSVDFNAPPDTTPPLVKIANPISGETVDHMVMLNANVRDDSVGLSKVQFFIDGDLVFADLNEPYSFHWNSVSVPNGLHQLTVEATDLANNVANQSISFNVLNTGDVTPPLISDVVVTGVSLTGAVIEWMTNEPADGVLQYGQTMAYGTNVSNASLSINHFFSLSGLTQNRLYHFRIQSVDAEGNIALSSDYTFHTLKDVDPPVILSANVIEVKQRQATIKWLTDEKSTSQVEYGLSSSYGNLTTLNNVKMSDHVQVLMNLVPNTLYHCRVISEDDNGNKSMSNDMTFTTLPQTDFTPPLISNISVENITMSSALIKWETDELSDSQIEYGVSAGYGQSTSLSGILKKSHSQSLFSLLPGTGYHFRVVSKDVDGNVSTSIDQTFSTTQVPMLTISNLTVAPLFSGSVLIRWETDKLSNSSVMYGVDGEPSGMSTNSNLMCKQHTLVLYGLNPSTLYEFNVVSRSPTGELGSVSDQKFISPSSPLGVHKVFNITPVRVTSNSIYLRWNSNYFSNSTVEYGLTSEYGLSKNLIQMTPYHRVEINGLIPATLYHYRVKSVTNDGQIAVSDDHVFRTSKAEPSMSAGQLNINDFSFFDRASTSIGVGWSANFSGNGQIDYGPTIDFGQSTEIDHGIQARHLQTIQNLNSETLYFMRIKSVDPDGNMAISDDTSFQTLQGEPSFTISNVAVVHISSFSAEIVWKTNEFSDSQVDYGISANYDQQTPIEASLVRDHSQILSGLDPNTVYHFRCRSVSEQLGVAESADFIFKTLPDSDVTPPVLAGIVASNIGTSSATISWTSDELSDTEVEYGPTVSYGKSVSKAEYVLSHSTALVGLSANTVIHYRVKSRDAAGNQAVSADRTFMTASIPPPSDVTPPVLAGIVASNIGTSSATISWTSDELSDTEVEYGPTVSYGKSVSKAEYVLSHSTALVGLSANTVIHYRVKSRDAAGNQEVSADRTFMTASIPPPSDVTPPVLAGIVASNIGTSSATISWTSDELSDTEVEYGPTVSYGKSVSKAEYVLSHSTALVGLSANTVIHYRVKSRDAAGNQAVSADRTFMTASIPPPSDVTPPVLAGIVASNIGTSSATISWTSDELSDTEVEYGPTVSYGKSVSKAEYVLSHSTALVGLSANTVIHYRVKSRDAAGNQAVSADRTFMTASIPPPSDVTPPVLAGIVASNIGTSSATISWTSDELSDTEVEYGPTVSYGKSVSKAEYVLSHSTALVGLSANTVIHYRVKSRDAAGNQAVSADRILTTANVSLPPVDEFPPKITNVKASHLLSDQVSISWVTDEPADTFIEYGLTESYGFSTIRLNDLTLTHFQKITGLLPDTEYHYRVISQDSSGNVAQNIDTVFRTLPTVSIPENPEHNSNANAPNIFNPSRGDVLNVGTYLQGQGVGEIRIFSRKGFLVWQQNGNTLTTWDGRNSNGLVVASGIYMVVTESGHYRVIVLK